VGADRRQQAFRLVCKLANLHQVEKARATFDRMDGPKDPIYPFLANLRSSSFESEKVTLNGSQVLPAFSQILPSQLVVKTDHRSLSSTTFLICSTPWFPPDSVLPAPRRANRPSIRLSATKAKGPLLKPHFSSG